MYNKNYTGEKIKSKDVFYSSERFPLDWFGCIKLADKQGFDYICFNGNVYFVNDFDENQGVDFSKVICEEEDIIKMSYVEAVDNSRTKIDIIDDTEESIKEYHDRGWGKEDLYVTKEQIEEFLNGKLLAINDGEYTHTIKLLNKKEN